MLQLKQTIGTFRELSGYRRAGLPGRAETGRGVEAPGLHEEAAHARQVGQGEDLVVEDRSPAAPQGRLLWRLARANSLAEPRQSIGALQVGEETIARAGGFDFGEFQ